MIEKITQDYLNDTMSAPAYLQIPDNPPEKFLIIEKTGGSVENFLKGAVLAIKSYAGSLYDAAQLNEELKTAMQNIAVLGEISSCKLNTDYNFSDTARGINRYQAVFDIFYY